MAASESEFVPILLALPSLTPSLALEVLPHGLTLHRLFVQADGRTHDLLIGPEDPKDHLTQKYTNTIVGRYANRLPVTESTLSRSGITATFTPLANENPEVSLHGGPSGFDSKEWTPLLDPSESQLFSQAEVQTIMGTMPAGSAIVFRRISEDGEEGFPGKLLVEALVGLVQPSGPQVQQEVLNLGSVVLVYRAKLLDKAKVTPINLTQHWGFNLDASLRDEDERTSPESLSVKDHKLTIQADNTIELTSKGLSSGALAPVKGTHHAHLEKETKKIGERWPESGYDEFYLFSSRDIIAPTRIPEKDLTPDKNFLQEILTTDQKDPVVELESDKSGLKITFDTNQSGVQFYSNNLTNPTKGARKKIHGGSGVSGAGDSYGVGSAAFLEFHEPLAAWQNPSTLGPSGDDTLLASGEIYNNYVRMDVWFKPPKHLKEE
ncbi:galactose mutarotase-like domain-containing protein [Abortiporus biennis]|nr:galactose mutarotase-like domain-containing protein [Abortiporus biennis]